MENVMIPQVVVETPSYLRAVENFWDNDTQIEFKNFIASNALIGDVIPNTGGLRKIRWQEKVMENEEVFASFIIFTTKITPFICCLLILKMFKMIYQRTRKN